MSLWKDLLGSFDLFNATGENPLYKAVGLNGILGTGVNYGDFKGYLDAWTGKANVDAQKEYNSIQQQIAAENNAAQYKMWQEQRGDNRKYFDDTMAFNSAAAQVDRLKQAGLNPALAMYQGVDSGTVSASSSPAPPVRQSPQISPVDYSPMANAITNSVSLLGSIAPAIESLLGLGDAAKRAGATTKKQQSEASSAESHAKTDAANANVAERVAKAGAKAAETAAAAAEYQLDTEKYNSLLSQLKTNALASYSAKHPGELEKLFTESFIAELGQKVSSKKLTDEQKNKVIKETAIAELQRKKEEFSKTGYEDLIKAINSVDNAFGRSLLHILSTWFMDMR